MADLLDGAAWECAATAPDAVACPAELPLHITDWRPCVLPATAASALRDSGAAGWEELDYDNRDWWFRTTLKTPEHTGRYHLELDGVATLAEVYLDGSLVGRGTSMYLPIIVDVGLDDDPVELAICCRALGPALAARRARAPWRTRLVDSPNLRYFRTTFFGRMPGVSDLAAPVGPFRPLRLAPASEVSITDQCLRARPRGEGGVVEASLTLRGVPGGISRAVLRVGEEKRELTIEWEGAAAVANAQVQLAEVERWWPHTHGQQTRYPVVLDVADTSLDLGDVGFVSVVAERSRGAFTLVVNDVPLFCRGVCWVPLDPLRLAAGAEEVRESLLELRRAGVNLVRLPGTGVYEQPAFYEACDELGLLVWQDCMLANLEPPDEDDHRAALVAELAALARLIGHRPSTAVICGGSEIEQQAAMAGADRERWLPALLDGELRHRIREHFPRLPFVSSSPTGGTLPFVNDVGVAHYFGVGAYRRPLDDARRAHVRFAAECLAFSVPPERQVVEELFGSAAAAGHSPAWKRGVPRDAGSSWDFEDVTAHYVHELFGVDPVALRSVDPERALDCARAAVVTCFTSALSEWRSGDCAGAVILSARDLRPGAGWGVSDWLGGRKCSWYALREVSGDLALLFTDEGLNGLRLHLLNERAVSFAGTVRVELYRDGSIPVGEASLAVSVPPRGKVALEAASAFDNFVDLTYAYRFGPPSHDTVALTLEDEAGEPAASAVYLPHGIGRTLEGDLGLRAVARQRSAGEVDLELTTERLATFVVPELDGYRPDAAWFHLAPGRTRTVRLRASDAPSGGNGRVRALNCAAETTFSVGGAA